MKTRILLSGAALVLLYVAATRAPSLGQGAVPFSRPGQEDLTFWVNHNGLEQIDALGEVGFGDLARILMRRRSNDEAFRKLRDRFVFTTTKASAITTPDTFRAELTAHGLEWRNKPERFVIAASHTFNLPIIVINSTGAAAKVEAEFTGSTAGSRFPGTDLAADQSAGYFLRVVESKPGGVEGKLTLRAGGREATAGIAFDVRPLVTLRVDLRDEQWRPTAGRVYVTAADGLAYAPRGSVSRISAMSGEYYFHAQDHFELELPAGQTLIEATRGQEYRLSHVPMDLKPGKLAPWARISLQRWENMLTKGWFTADAHIHANYTADHHQVIDGKDIRLQTDAEDLNNANLMVANSSAAFLHDIQYFEGRPNALSKPNFILYWNEEMRSGGMYGHMCYFGLKHLVEPLYTGFRNTPYWEDYPPNYTQNEAARKQGGAVTYAHPGMRPTFDGVGGAGARELPVDLALGQVDAMDVLSNNDEIADMQLWYRLLNCGFRLAISAGTDSFTNVADHYTPGGGRVYVNSGGVNSILSYDGWIAAYKKGRSFASNGPIVLLTVDGKVPGDDLHFEKGAHPKVRIRATLHTQAPVDKLEVVINGKVAIAKETGGQNELRIDEAVPLEHSAWIAARAIGSWNRLVLNDVQAFAHTSPVYVQFGDERIASKEDAQFWIDWIDRLIAQTNQRGRFATPEHKREVVQLFQRAQAVYRQL